MRPGSGISIVGYACRLPGAPDSGALWNNLEGNECTIGRIGDDRFPTHALLHPVRETRGRSYTFAAGTIDDVWGFDAAAFGISPREAEQIDPQQRQLLEVAFDALHHAGIPPSSLAGGRTGVYVGASSLDYAARFLHDPSASDVHMMTGNTLSLISNRLSYVLDLHGPSLTIDTACSSSLVALCQAANAIQHGEIDTAIVGGVNLLLSPFPFVGFSRASMLSPSGRCRPFDANADGYVRSEGVVALVLQSSDAAKRSRSRVHAELAGWATGQDGRTTGVSLPSMEAQRRLLERLYRKFKLSPSDLAFVEAHGTGTPAGDPIEAEALGRALGTSRRRPLPIGSIKSNLGHLEPAAGLAGVLKAMMALEKGVLPASLSFDEPNPNIAFEELNLTVAGGNQAVAAIPGMTLAGVNSFGFGGTIAHVVLRSALSAKEKGVLTAGKLPPLLLSAHSRPALDALARAHADAWPADEVEARSWIDASAFRRDRLPHRLAILDKGEQGIRGALARYSAGEDGFIVGEALGERVPAVFVFSGNGAQWVGMAKDAWATNPAFRAAFEEVDARFADINGSHPLADLESAELATRLRRATTAQPLLFSIQYSIVRALGEQGLTPSATVGHSIGEIAAAWAAGALALDDAIRIVGARSRHQEPVRGSGGMVAALVTEAEIREALASAALAGVDVAAINSPRSVTLSGPDSQLDEFIAFAQARRWSAVRLDLDYPFHSALIDQVRTPLLGDLASLDPRKTKIPFFSTVTGKLCRGERLVADHWWYNVRQPVKFAPAIDALVKGGHRLFVEIGPKPILSGYLRDILRDQGVRGLAIETLSDRKGAKRTDPIAPLDDADDPIAVAVGRALVAGADIDFGRLYGPVRAGRAVLPRHPWQHKPFKVERSSEATAAFATADHPLLGARAHSGVDTWHATLDATRHSWLADHKVRSTILFPASAFAESLLAAARQVLGDEPVEIRDLDIFQPLALAEHSPVETMVRVSPDRTSAEFLSRPRLHGDDWTLHARATIGRRAGKQAGASGDLKPLGAATIGGEELYGRAAQAGFDYGPHFRRVLHAVVTEDSSVEMEFCPPPDGFGVAPFVVDPTALDAALHGLLALAPSNDDQRDAALLPVRIGLLRMHVAGAEVAQARLRLVRRRSRSAVIDIELRDTARRIVAEIRQVRFALAPSAEKPAAQMLYRERPLVLDRAGAPSRLGRVALPARARASATAAGALVETACLRAAWERLRARQDGHLTIVEDVAAGSAEPATEASDVAELQDNAILWALEQHGFARNEDGRWTPAAECSLPEASETIRKLLHEQPAYGLEAACVADLVERLDAQSGANSRAPLEAAPTLGRRLRTGAVSLVELSRIVLEAADRALRSLPADTIARLLVVGAEHADLAIRLARAHPTLEVTVTDHDVARLQEAEDNWAEADLSRVSWRTAASLPELEPETFDLAVAVDSLHRLAATSDLLLQIRRALRPRAQLVVAELAPGLFWDLVRGDGARWWARTSNREFPISPLLPREDWLAELSDAGFDAGGPADPGDCGGHGSLIVATKTSSEPRSVLAPLPMPRILGDRDAFTDRLSEATAATEDHAGLTVWYVAPRPEGSEAGDGLSDTLTALATLLRDAPVDAAPLWIVGRIDAGAEPTAADADPRWRAIVAAARVARNEYPDRTIRCVGIGRQLEVDDAIALLQEEWTRDSAEPEIVLNASLRLVTRVERLPSGRAEWKMPDAVTSVRLQRPLAGPPVWAAVPRQPLGEDEVEIEVAAAGLNFRDVMWSLGLLPDEALEDGYAGATLGMECAGTVARTGSAACGFNPGDRVVALAPASFATHAVAPHAAVFKLPEGIAFEEAAALPVAYLTAWYALVTLGRLAPGESVLIHGAAGGVGLAALSIAKRRGAVVFATAGSVEKRALLKALGADHVLDSRSIDFAQAIDDITAGRGVDIVLNSLAGDAMARSVDCLAPFGRFLELGKRDFYANSRLALRPLRNNISYHAIDVDRLIDRDRGLARSILEEVMRLLASDELAPLPYRSFDGEQTDEALRLMQRSHHVGKIVLAPAHLGLGEAPKAPAFRACPDGLHVVVGGLGGFGMATVQWLASRGARHFLLLGRSGRANGEHGRLLDAMAAQGISVDSAAVDVSDMRALDRLLRQAAMRRPVKGIVHAAMVLDDRLIADMDHASIDAVVRPKVTGAENLDLVTRSMPLDYFLLFSSATTTVGNPGQFNYVAANAFMEALARRRRRLGLPATAVAWGAIGDAGYLARNVTESRALRRRLGESMLMADEALANLDLLLTADPDASPIVAPIDWRQAHRELATVHGPQYGWVRSLRRGHDATDSDLVRRIRELPAEQREEVLGSLVRGEIARALRLPASEVLLTTSLAEIGMDSLMMLELRTAIEERLEIELPIMTLGNGLAPADIVRRLMPLMDAKPDARASVPGGALGALAGSHLNADELPDDAYVRSARAVARQATAVDRLI